MSEVRPGWLEAADEAPLEPDLLVYDPHHHHWEHGRQPYMRAELLSDLRGHRVQKTVFVECGTGYYGDGPKALLPVGETAFVERIAEQRLGPEDSADFDAGIVGFADLLLGNEVQSVLEAHLAVSPQRFRGIRHSAAWHESPAIRRSHAKPPPHMLGLPEFREGFAQLRRYGLSFDAWLFHSQLDELTDLAQQFDDTVIVLDHLGGPLGIGPFAGRHQEVFEDWSAAIDRLARCENVVVKLGGLQMEICGFGWHELPTPPGSLDLLARLGPYYLHCIERFGPERCMFESNFPVDRVSCSYNVLWNFFKRLTTGFATGEREALFHRTAKRVYRL